MHNQTPNPTCRLRYATLACLMFMRVGDSGAACHFLQHLAPVHLIGQSIVDFQQQRSKIRKTANVLWEERSSGRFSLF